MAENDTPNAEALAAIASLCGGGGRVLLCTGRILEELRLRFPDADPSELALALRTARVPFGAGHVLLVTEAAYDDRVLDMNASAELEAQLSYNRGALLGRCRHPVGVVAFHVTERSIPHVRHRHKYMWALYAHLYAGDVSRWMRDVLADDELGRRVRGVERWYRNETNGSVETARQAILAAIDDRYGREAKGGERPVPHGP